MQSSASCNCDSKRGDTSVGPECDSDNSTVSNGSLLAKEMPAAAMHTDLLTPQAQQTKVGTLARIRAATDSEASRSNQSGLSPPSDKGNRSRIKSRGNAANGSLSANSTTAWISRS